MLLLHVVYCAPSVASPVHVSNFNVSQSTAAAACAGFAAERRASIASSMQLARVNKFQLLQMDPRDALRSVCLLSVDRRRSLAQPQLTTLAPVDVSSRNDQRWDKRSTENDGRFGDSSKRPDTQP